MSVHDLPVPPAPALPEHAGAFGPRDREALAETFGGEVIQPLADLAQRPRVIPDDNPHKLVARYRKAKKIAKALRHAVPGVTHQDAEDLGSTEIGRELAGAVAHTNVPSDVTWALVVEMLRDES